MFFVFFFTCDPANVEKEKTQRHVAYVSEGHDGERLFLLFQGGMAYFLQLGF